MDAQGLSVSRRHPLPGRVMRSMIPRGMDWHTRKVLAWRISNTLEADFCPLGRFALANRLPGNGRGVERGAGQVWQARDPEQPLSGHCCAMPCRAMDQGSQFTGFEWTNALIEAGVKISMDGHRTKGASLTQRRWPPLIDCFAINCRATDNRMIERLWRSLKYECVYLRAFETGTDARAEIGH